MVVGDPVAKSGEPSRLKSAVADAVGEVAEGVPFEADEAAARRRLARPGDPGRRRQRDQCAGHASAGARHQGKNVRTRNVAICWRRTGLPGQ